MSAAAVEVISPELVLVCPELRERAVELLPDIEWHSFVAQVRMRTTPDVVAQPDPVPLVRRFVSELIERARPAGFGGLSCIAATLTLTLIADAIR